MKTTLKKEEVESHLVPRRGFYLDVLNYRETSALALGAELAQELIETYHRLKSPLGYVSYTDISRALEVPAGKVMEHIKHLHIHSREWRVRFSSNRYNENVLFKLERRA